MDLENFRQLFGDNIRAWLAWDQLSDAGATISEKVLKEGAELGQLRTVWYRDREGRTGDWRDPTSTPQSVEETVAHRAAWDSGRRERVETFRQEYLRFSEPIVMMVPAYATSPEPLLLDSTHRAVAAYMSNRPVRLLVLAIVGPISASILPDLSHFPVEAQ